MAISRPTNEHTSPAMDALHAPLVSWTALGFADLPLCASSDFLPLLIQSLQPIKYGGLQRDAMVVVAVVGFHVDVGGAGVAGFLQRFKERVIFGIVAVG